MTTFLLGSDGGDDYTDWTTMQLTESEADGDTVSFRKGETFREQITVPDSGSSNVSRITYNAHGTGADPIINGSDLIAPGTSWDAVADPQNIGDDSATVNGGSGHTGNQIYFHKVTTTGAGTVPTAYVFTQSSEAAGTVKCAIYTDVSGEPTALVTNGTSNEVNWAHDDEWVTFTFGTPPTVTADTEYWIAIWSSEYYWRQKGAGGTNNWKWDAETYDGWPEPPTIGDTGSYSDVDVYMKVDVDSLADQWQTTCVTEPDIVFFDGDRGNIQTALGDVDSENDWFWAGGILFVYSATDPDTAYTDPGIEVALRDYCIYGLSKDYITIEDLELKNAEQAGIQDGLGDYWIIDGVTAHHNGFIEGATDNNIVFIDSDNSLTKNCTLYRAGTHGYFIYGGSNNILENSTVYDNHHANIDIQGGNTGHGCDGNIVRYNLSYFNNGYGDINAQSIFLRGYDGNTVTNTEIYYNLVYSLGSTYTHSSQVYSSGGDWTTGTLIYNNVFFSAAGECGLRIYCETGSCTVKNNIGKIPTSSSGALRVTDSTSKTINNNCWDVDSGVVCYVDDVTGGDGPGFTEAEWASYQSETGFDASGINADPTMTDPANGDFTLQVGSPCINAGVDVSLTTDYAGNIVGALPDIGAYELIGAISTIPPMMGGDYYLALG